MNDSIFSRNSTPIAIAIAAFSCGIAVSIPLSVLLSQGGSPVATSELPTSLEGTPTPRFFFVNNLRVVLFLLFGGITLGVVTILVLFTNGLIIGSAVASSVQTVPLQSALLLTVPHGLFELPALWLAGAAGLRLPLRIVRYLLKEEDRIVTTEVVIDVTVIAALSIGLLAIAALVEGIVTPYVFERL